MNARNYGLDIQLLKLLRPGKRYLVMKILTEMKLDQYLWQRIMPQWRIKLVRQPRMKVARMQLKKTADARGNLISKQKEKKDSRLRRKPQQRTE